MSDHDEQQKRIVELESQLGDARLRLAAKEREVAEIYRSRAWRLVAGLRSLKQRLGIKWPRRRALAKGSVDIAPAQPGKFDVICFAIHEWDFRWQRAQQLMSRFAADGHRVFFIPPHGATAARKAENVYELAEVPEGIGEAIVIVQLPSWWPVVKTLPWPVVYDCMDLHEGFATGSAKFEEELLRRADLVVVSSAALEARAKRYRDDVLLLRNACDFERFAKTKRANNARPVVGYYGAIAEWFDSELVSQLAARRSDWDFILIGSLYGARMARLGELPNVKLVGEQPYESLPEWLSGFDVAIIPFTRTKLTEATNPVKVYEMLAGGKPVVSVPIPEVAALAPLVRLASTVDEFGREIEAALSESQARSDERKAFAREQTWQQRYEVLKVRLPLRDGG